MNHPYKGTVIEDIIPVLLKDKKAKAQLKKHGIKPEVYVAWVYETERKKILLSSWIIGGILTVGMGTVGFISGKNDSTEATWISGGSFATLFALISWLAARHAQGKGLPYTTDTNPGALEFSLIGILNRFKPKKITALSENTLKKIHAYKPDFSHKKFHAAPGQNPVRKQTVSKGRLALAEKIDQKKRWPLYLSLLGPLAFFTEGLLFVWIGLFFIGIWIALDSTSSFLKKEFEYFAVTSAQTLHGWPAQVSAIVLMSVGILIGILPGILGVFDHFGISLVDLVFT